MKKLKFRFILPLLLALMLALGSCMTVCAASSLPDYSQVDTSKYDSEYPYHFFTYSYTKINAFFSSQPLMFKYREDSDIYLIVIPSGAECITVQTSDYGASWGKAYGLGNNSYITSQDVSTIYTTYDIKDSDTGKVFFRPPLVLAAVPLKAEVLKQTKVILPAGVGCLALLIGSAVLLPRLRRSLLRL